MAWDLFVSYSGAQRDFVAPLARSLNEDHGLATEASVRRCSEEALGSLAEMMRALAPGVEDARRGARRAE